MQGSKTPTWEGGEPIEHLLIGPKTKLYFYYASYRVVVMLDYSSSMNTIHGLDYEIQLQKLRTALTATLQNLMVSAGRSSTLE